jgi:hypothetical protein
MYKLLKNMSGIMRIYGTFRDSKNREPVKQANIKLSIEGTEIASYLHMSRVDMNIRLKRSI